jgi:hypothetical protein
MSGLPTTRIIRGFDPAGVNIIGEKEIPGGREYNEVVTNVPSVDKVLPTVESADDTPDVVKSEESQPVLVDNDFAESELSESIDVDSVKTAETDVFTETNQSAAPSMLSVPKQKKAVNPRKREKYDKGSLLQNPYVRELIDSDDDTELSRLSDLVVDKYDDSTESEGRKSGKNAESEKSEVKAEVPKRDEAVEIDSSDELPALDFGSILSGIKRKDGFEKSESVKSHGSNHGDDSPVTHKTKRVMDAIFGKNKIVNPFVKNEEINRDFNHDDEDYTP